jgi:hypothetical protein
VIEEAARTLCARAKQEQMLMKRLTEVRVPPARAEPFSPCATSALSTLSTLSTLSADRAASQSCAAAKVAHLANLSCRALRVDYTLHAKFRSEVAV